MMKLVADADELEMSAGTSISVLLEAILLPATFA